MLPSKWKKLFYEVNTYLQETTTCTALQAGRIFSVSLSYLYLFNFGRGFCGSFFMLFPDAPAACNKEILKYFFPHCTSICMTLKNVSQIHKILVQNWGINNFVLRCVFFSRYVQLKSSFPNKENISGEIWDTL